MEDSNTHSYTARHQLNQFWLSYTGQIHVALPTDFQVSISANILCNWRDDRKSGRSEGCWSISRQQVHNICVKMLNIVSFSMQTQAAASTLLLLLLLLKLTILSCELYIITAAHTKMGNNADHVRANMRHACDVSWINNWDKHAISILFSQQSIILQR